MDVFGAGPILLKSLRLILLPLALVAMTGLTASSPAQEAAPAAPAAAAALPNVMDVRVSVTPERSRLIIDLAAKTEFAMASMSGPDRIAIDVRAATFSVPEPAGDPAGEGDMISGYTVEQGRRTASARF